MHAGDVINGYKLNRLLGEGGMGKVFLGEQLNTGEKVAVKILLNEHLHNQYAKDSFRQDAMILSELRHKNIVRLVDFFEDALGHFMVMEAVDGIQLDQYILRERGLLPYVEAIGLFNQVLDGLAYAHSQGIIHRDIKPENILIDKKGQVKIIDFGIAKMLDSDKNLAKTMANQGVGTPLYMSPEQVKGEKVNITTDVYSSAIVFYFMLTGKNPYRDEKSLFELNKKIVHDPLPNPSQYYPFIPPRIDNIIQDALKKDPLARTQSCELFKSQLTKTLEVPAEFGWIKVKVSNGPAAIVCGSQGGYGHEATFNVLLHNEYTIKVLASGREEVSQKISPQKDEFLSIELPVTGKSDKSSSTSLMTLIGWGLFILSILFFSLMMMNKSKDIEDLKRELKRYDQFSN
jgi:serine/threonine protein kinase